MQATMLMVPPPGAAPADVDDLLQEVFVTALEKIASLRDAGAVGAWLAMIARNLATDGLRARKHLVPLSRELIVRLEAVIKKTDPRMIFVNSPEDTHQDHRHLAQSALSATRYVPNLLFFEVPSTVNFTPNCATDIADVMETKLAGLAAHESQVTKTNIEDLTILELARSCANFRGIQARVKYAEAFQSVRLLLNL